jgi:DNA polymerase-3 subunit gamma/tau
LHRRFTFYMSYLALARKWRPKKFADVSGQEHIVRALVNALESERVHHAYLFAGTRGIGKTTVARILAKALNCEAGVQAEPCGECGACVSIDEGRFVDLIEVDAASKTKVDDTRELLENVQYTPTAGRYKVYLIDEVHMLSNHSFNALLKTLEDPPPQVKYLLATTDPQKLPVTVLSRCLHINLKRLPSTLIVERMIQICAAEGIEADSSALTRLARAAAGSMRDGLSLLDQGVAFCGDALRDADIAEMLGSMDPRHIADLLRCLAAGDAVALMAQIQELQQLVPDYEAVLDDLATTLQQIAVIQLAGADSLDEDVDASVLLEFADALDSDLVQLYYQIAITGRHDLNLAPDPRIGFEMTLLRMLAFQPAGSIVPVAPAGGGAPRQTQSSPQSPPQSKGSQPSRSAAAATPAPAAAKLSADADWPTLMAAMQLKGAARQLAENCALLVRTDTSMELSVNRVSEHLLTEQLQGRLIEALRKSLGAGFQVAFTVVDAEVDTVAARDAKATDNKVSAARAAIENDPNVQDMKDMFGAQVDQDSIQPVDGAAGNADS